LSESSLTKFVHLNSLQDVLTTEEIPSSPWSNGLLAGKETYPIKAHVNYLNNKIKV